MDLLSLVARLSLDSSEYENGLNNAEGRAGSFGDKLKSGLKTAAKVGAAAVGAATTAVGAFAKSSIDAGQSFDSSMAQVAATMGKTVGELESEVGETDTAFGHFSGTLREFAQYMGANTSFSASQAADALNYMALAGYDAQTSMDMLPNVLNLAAAGGIDLAYASDMVTDASSALGLSLDETSLLVDQMAKASSKSNTSVAQLGEAILTVGGTAKMLRGGTTELSMALGVLADNGVKGAEGGTALRNILLSLSSPTDKAADAMESLGLQVFDAQGKMKPLNWIFEDLGESLDSMSDQERTEVLSNIFNKVDLKSVNALLGTSAERFQELSVEIDGAWMTSESLDKALAEMGTSTEELATRVGALGISTEDFNDILKYSNGDADAFADYIWEAADAGVSFEDVVDALGGDLDALGKAFYDTTGAAQAMADTQLDNLEGDITIFKSALEGVQIAISNMLTPTLREFVQLGSSGLSEVTDALKNGDFSGAMDALGKALSNGIEMIISMIPQMVEAGMQLLSALGQGIIDNLPQIIDAAIQIVTMLVQYIIQALPQLVDAALQIIFTLADGLVDAIPDLIPAIVEIILVIVDKLTEPSTLMQMIEVAFKLLGAVADGLLQAIPKLIEKVPTIIMNLIEAILRFLPQLLASGMKLIASLAMGILQAGVEAVNAIIKVVGSIKDGFMERVNDAKEWGKDLIQNFIDGILSKWNDLKESVSNVAQTVRDFIGFSEPKEGPLSNFHTYAPDMMELFAKGIKDNEKLIKDQIGSSFDFQNSISGTTPANSASSTGNVFNINVYGAQGQDEQKLVDILMDEITRRTERERMAFA